MYPVKLKNWLMNTTGMNLFRANFVKIRQKN